MNARQKLNRIYATGAIVVAAVVGAGPNSWWAFGVGLAVLLGLNTRGGRPGWPRPAGRGSEGRRPARERAGRFITGGNCLVVLSRPSERWQSVRVL